MLSRRHLGLYSHNALGLGLSWHWDATSIHQWPLMRDWSWIQDSSEPGTYGHSAQELCTGPLLSIYSKITQSSKQGWANNDKHTECTLLSNVLTVEKVSWSTMDCMHNAWWVTLLGVGISYRGHFLGRQRYSSQGSEQDSAETEFTQQYRLT